MAAPTQEQYFADDFDAGTLKARSYVPQLRSILVEHSIPVPGKALRADLLELFETQVLPKRNALLAKAGKVKASARGIISVDSNGDEALVEPIPVPAKRGRGRPKKSTSEEPAAAAGEPAAKRSRLSTRASRTPALGDDESGSVSGGRSARGSAVGGSAVPEMIEEVVEVVEVVKKPRGRPKKSVAHAQEVPPVRAEDGDEAEIEDEPEKVAPVKAPRKSRARSKPPAEPSSPLSSPAHLPTKSIPAQHTPTPPPQSEPPKSILKKKTSIHFLPDAPSPASASGFADIGGSTSASASASEPSRATTTTATTTTPSKRKARTMQTPRKGSDGEESGFSDANPFQSGNESARREEKQRRKSTMGVTTKRDPDEPLHKTPRRSEPAPFSFTPGRDHPQPRQSLAQAPPSLRKLGPSQEDLKSPPMSVRKQMLRERDRENEEAEAYNRVIGDKLAGREGTSSGAYGGSEEEEEEEEEQVEYVQREANEDAEVDVPEFKEDTPDVVVTAHSMPPASPSDSSFALIRRPSVNSLDVRKASTYVPLSAILLPLLLWLSNWKASSSSIGYCDTALPSNAIAVAREIRRSDAAACYDLRAEQKIAGVPADQLVSCDYAALPLIPFLPQPTACAPCPPHAECENGRIVACEPEYLLADSPLAFLEPVLGGLPGVGPMAFPAKCRPDTEKKRYIGEMARELEGFLARARGGVECARQDKGRGKEGEGEGRVYGLKEEDLRGVFEPRRDPKVSPEQFHEVWEAALKDLIDHEDLVETIDVDGISWYAAKRSEMSLACSAKTKVYKNVDEWKSQLASTLAIIAGIAALQRRFKTRRLEKYRADQLAQVVLKRLQDQQYLYSRDPDATPSAYLPPAQLRDLVLPPKGSVASRKRTWERVERMIEKNANVASREREVGGEVWSTWEWTGPAGAAATTLPLGYEGAEQGWEGAGEEVQRSPARIKL